MASSLQTLFMPLENGDVPFASGRTLFLNAAYHPFLRSIADPVLYQPFAPLAAELSSAGLSVSGEPPPRGPYALAIVNLPKQVEEAKYMLACALGALDEGGWIVAGAANDANGNRIEKWLEEAGVRVSAQSKNKARVVWGQRPAALSDTVSLWAAEGSAQDVQFGDGEIYKSQPGLFSWNRLDAGTALLMANLPQNLKGAGADFGAGLGILSRHILKKNPAIKHWHVCEGDSRALAFSRHNLENVQGDRTLDFHWADLTRAQKILPPLDLIVMNPPFHAGKKTDTHAGQDFIRSAAKALKKGGRLYMVANLNLPYEDILKSDFGTYRQIAQDNGFKILEGVK